MSQDMSLERRARAYLAAIEGGADADELAGFYHPDAVLIEYPNRLNPSGAQKGLAEIVAGAEAGAKMLSRQFFDVHIATEAGDRVILEMTWTGYPTMPIGMLRPGEPMRARVAQVIEFEDGLIIRQRTYDCFEQF